MVPYCAQKLFWVIFWRKKEKLKVGSKELKVNWLQLKSLSIDFFEVEKENHLKVDSSELKANWIQLKSFLINIDFFEGWTENQLNVDSKKLKANWFQLKPFLINRFLWSFKEKSIESRFKWIESKLVSIEMLSYQYFFKVIKGKAIERRLISIECISYHLVNRFLQGLKGKSIEHRFQWIES